MNRLRMGVVVGSVMVLWLALGHAGWAQESSKSAGRAASTLRFEVASVRPTDPRFGGWKIAYTVNGFTARGASLVMLVKEAYGTYEEGRVLGEKGWMMDERFDIEARLDADEMPDFKALELDERRAMLRALLEERFNLKAHKEQREMPVYALTVAKGGPKMHETAPDTAYGTEIKGIETLISKSRSGLMEGTNFTMPGLAVWLASNAGGMVVDRTGLKGRYDVSLHWTPEGSVDGANGEVAGLSLFTAVRQQLGLSLNSTKAPVEVIVMDSASKPSEN